MTTGWTSVWTELLPLALVVALSPLTVIPAVLVLHTPHPRPTSLAFLLGWLTGLAALTGGFAALSGLFDGLHRQPPAWASWLRIAVGSALIIAGGYLWATRRQHTDMPRWLRSLTALTPPRAGLTAAALAAIRPEVLLMCAAAGFSIGSAGLGATGNWLAAGVFVGVAGSSVALPVLGYLAASDRLDPALTRLKDWMERRHAVMLAIVLAAIGAMVLYNGIHALHLH